MTIATIKKEIKDLKNALNTNLDEKFKVKLREQLSKSEKTLAEMESAKTPTAKKTATKKANVVAKKSTSVLQKVKQANKKAEPKKSTPAKKSTSKQPSALQKIKNQVKLNKNLSGYKKSGIDLLRDGNRPALPAGKRISKDGNTYYEYRLNHVDVRQPSKKVAKPNKLQEGGMVKNFNVMRNVGKSKYVINSYDGVKKHKDGSPFYDIDTFKNLKDFMQYKKKLKSEGYKEMADGGMMAKGGNVRSLLKNFNEEKPTIALIMIADDVSNDFMKEKFDKTIKWNELSDGEKQKYNEDYKVNKSKFDTYLMNEFVKLYYSDDKIKLKCKGSGIKTLDAIKSVMIDLAKKYDESKYEDGGMMAKGGMMEDYYDDIRVYVQGVGTIYQGHSRKEATEVFDKYYDNNPHAEMVMVDEKYGDELQWANINDHNEYDEDEEFFKSGGMMAKGGRLKSALMRDRAYKSNEPYEQAYKRKTRPKNPKYNFGFFEDGGSTEMHRAYAMGGVLQHGLESGDFIVSHDEGKMVVMNGGSKYEVNIHSGSRTKID
jgi:hypothetical protein